MSERESVCALARGGEGGGGGGGGELVLCVHATADDNTSKDPGFCPCGPPPPPHPPAPSRTLAALASGPSVVISAVSCVVVKERRRYEGHLLPSASASSGEMEWRVWRVGACGGGGGGGGGEIREEVGARAQGVKARITEIIRGNVQDAGRLVFVSFFGFGLFDMRERERGVGGGGGGDRERERTEGERQPRVLGF